jgi:hypothetical protein
LEKILFWSEEMKLEIEITEEEIKSAVERKVRTAIADQTNQWGTDLYIRNQIAASWKKVVDQMINDALSKSPIMQAKIEAEIEAKLRRQLAAIMGAKK